MTRDDIMTMLWFLLLLAWISLAILVFDGFQQQRRLDHLTFQIAQLKSRADDQQLRVDHSYYLAQRAINGTLSQD